MHRLIFNTELGNPFLLPFTPTSSIALAPDTKFKRVDRKVFHFLAVMMAAFVQPKTCHCALLSPPTHM